MLLLMAMWTRDGSLPNDQKKLQRVARVGRDWPKIWDAISHYFTVQDGKIFQSRLTRELQKVNAKREVNAQAGARGGRAKALKNNKSPLADATVSLKQPEPYSEVEEDKSPSTSAQEPDLVLEVMSVCGLTSGRIPTHWLPPAATIHVNRWLTDLKLNRSEILAAAKASRQQHSEPPNGPKALDRVMQNLSQAKAAGKMHAATGRTFEPLPTIPRAAQVGADIPSNSFADELPPADPKFARR